jgi:uncharacterized protein YcbK (DUF882 family)
MISMKELLGDHMINDIPLNHQHNLEELLLKINKVRVLFNKPMIVTSGYRSEQDHLRIYRSKGVPDNKIPMGSAHLKGAAVDILDKDGSLFKWCKDNVNQLETIELWCEDDQSVPRVHFQIYPPKSGNRFFKP